MSQMNDPKMSNEMDEIRGDLNKLRDDLRSLADHAMGQGKEQARHAQQQFQGGWEQSMSTLQRQIEERPLATMAGAFVVGVLMGRIMGK